ncbi:ParB/RepB/Spo0J family partition protein [Stratiformator vulcanicus]|uniref:Putative chromosome-partitioning protein ParB n=1 Tax=Stratiformator vulcanicus TaxID=2527980 RepID=A0A517R4G5_9PLAN|nr:ParB/RepB/Spo0J family partition protein [Stratiformator vulcanicus]QDT38713.1 putative chromosome-partitioning protein ParB [Stratiformator vulcanicus]
MDDHGQQSQDAHDDQALTPMRRLGRGLNALLGGEESTEGAASVGGATVESNHIHVELIDRNPFQPRKDFGEPEIIELATSIRRHGVLQPLLVRPAEGQYQLIAGERRLMAARQVGLETVPCRVLEVEDRLVCEVAIEENLKRKDLNVLEKAQAFRDYIDRFDSTVEELAQNLGLNRSTVSNYIRLLDLTEPVKRSIRKDEISNGHAKALLTLDADEQVALCKQIAKEGLSVRATEKAVRELQGRGESATEAQTDEAAAGVEGEEPNPDVLPMNPEGADDPHMTSHVQSIVDQLRDMLGTKVEIKMRGKDAGKIMIDFNTSEEFERIVGHLRSAA